MARESFTGPGRPPGSAAPRLLAILAPMSGAEAGSGERGWRRRRLLAALGAAGALLAGCGQKGPLYLPPEEPDPARTGKKDPKASLGRRTAGA